MLIDVYQFEMSMKLGGKSYSDQSRLYTYCGFLFTYPLTINSHYGPQFGPVCSYTPPMVNVTSHQ